MKRQARQISSYTGRAKEKGNRWILAGAVVCLALSLFLLFVPGMRFSAIFCFALAMSGIAWVIIKRFAEISIWGKTCKALFLAGVFLLIPLLGSFEIMVIAHSAGDDPNTPVDAVIVLGAGVNGEQPSLSLQTRIDVAAEYLLAHPEVPAVLSGGKGNGELISEAEAMRRGLVKLGVEEERLLLEDRSTNTAENFSFSKELLRSEGFESSAVVAVVSNDFHLFRAELIARREGLTPVGIPAKFPWRWLEANYFLREAFALVKTLAFD